MRECGGEEDTKYEYTLQYAERREPKIRRETKKQRGNVWGGGRGQLKNVIFSPTIVWEDVGRRFRRNRYHVFPVLLKKGLCRNSRWLHGSNSFTYREIGDKSMYRGRTEKEWRTDKHSDACREINRNSHLMNRYLHPPHWRQGSAMWKLLGRRFCSSLRLHCLDWRWWNQRKNKRYIKVRTSG